MKSQSISDYKKLFSRMRWFVCLVPLGGWLTQNRIPFLFPPFGDNVHTGLTFAVSTVLAGIAALLPWKLDLTKVKSALLIGLALLAVGSVIPYFYLIQKYVISTTPTGTGPLTVTIGMVRSEFALDNLRDYTDEEMLKELGPNEPSVHKLWTEDSILSVRLRLFLSYLGWLIPLNLILGICAREDPSP
jgi:hypothetical protein